jgi:hypothetical protein
VKSCGYYDDGPKRVEWVERSDIHHAMDAQQVTGFAKGSTHPSQTVMASQQGSAKACPMTGSAKIHQRQKERVDCAASLAMSGFNTCV